MKSLRLRPTSCAIRWLCRAVPGNCGGCQHKLLDDTGQTTLIDLPWSATSRQVVYEGIITIDSFSVYAYR
jgi:hypothetical protein